MWEANPFADDSRTSANGFASHNFVLPLRPPTYSGGGGRRGGGFLIIRARSFAGGGALPAPGISFGLFTPVYRSFHSQPSGVESSRCANSAHGVPAWSLTTRLRYSRAFGPLFPACSRS